MRCGVGVPVVQGNIAKWVKAVGDPVSAGDVLCEIETVSQRRAIRGHCTVCTTVAHSVQGHCTQCKEMHWGTCMVQGMRSVRLKRTQGHQGPKRRTQHSQQVA